MCLDCADLVDKLARFEDELRAERARNAPLRARIKALQDQHDKDTAALKRDLVYLRILMTEATHHYRNNQPEMHRLGVEALIAQCSEDFANRIERFPLSAYDQATIAVVMGHNEQLRVERDALALSCQELRAELDERTRERDGARARVRRRDRIIESWERGIASRDEEIAALRAAGNVLAPGGGEGTDGRCH